MATLTMCTIAFAMLPVLDKGKALEALVQYVSMHLSMEEDLKRIDDDPAWKDLARGSSFRQVSTDWSLGRLLDYRAETMIPLLPSNSPPSAQAPVEIKDPRLRIQRRIEPLHRIAENLEEISRGDLLAQARRHSSLYDRSIRRWAMRRDGWIMEGIAKDGPGLYIPAPDVPNITRSVRRETILKYLSLSQVRELSTYELPSPTFARPERFSSCSRPFCWG